MMPLPKYCALSFAFRYNETVICSTVTVANDHHRTHFVAPTLIAKSHGWCILSISSFVRYIPKSAQPTTAAATKYQNAKYKKRVRVTANRRKNIAKKLQKSAFEIENCPCLVEISFLLTSFSCAFDSIERILWIQLVSKNAIDSFFSPSSALATCAPFPSFLNSYSVIFLSRVLCYSRLCNHFIRFTLMTEEQTKMLCIYSPFFPCHHFDSVFNFGFAKCIRSQSILSSISR